MFSRNSRKERELEEQQAKKDAKKEEYDRDRLMYFKDRIENAKDGHERTQILIEYRTDLLSDWLREWLTDFERRAASEMRQRSKQMQGLLWGLVIALALHHFL